MKERLTCLLAAAAMVLLGCGKSNQPSQSSSTSPPAPTNVPAADANQQQSVGGALEQYGHTLAKVKRQTLEKTDFITVDRAVQAFQADRGKNPESLDELIKEGFLPKLPDLPVGKKYSYNQQSGEVKIVDAP